MNMHDFLHLENTTDDTISYPSKPFLLTRLAIGSTKFSHRIRTYLLRKTPVHNPATTT